MQFYEIQELFFKGFYIVFEKIPKLLTCELPQNLVLIYWLHDGNKVGKVYK